MWSGLLWKDRKAALVENIRYRLVGKISSGCGIVQARNSDSQRLSDFVDRAKTHLVLAKYNAVDEIQAKGSNDQAQQANPAELLPPGFDSNDPVGS